MLAKRVRDLPEGEGWIFEPKWDGFRALVFRDGDELLIQSRDEKPLDRYFPELGTPLPRSCRRAACSTARSSSRTGRRARLRGAAAAPAPGRVAREEARRARCRRRSSFWDLLCDGRPRTCWRRPSASDGRCSRRSSPTRRRRCTSRPRRPTARVAADWFRRFEGAGLDGVMAKPADGHLRAEQARHVQGEARARLRLRGRRAFAGTRAAKGTAVGSLLLGLYDDEGALQHVGVCASFTAEKRRELRRVSRAVPRERARGSPVASVGRQRTIEDGADAAHARARKSRWSQGKDLSWEPLRPELVVEVAYDHMQGSRFRHTAQFRRWRQDKPPARVHLRAARGRAAARAGAHLRDRAR